MSTPKKIELRVFMHYEATAPFKNMYLKLTEERQLNLSESQIKLFTKLKVPYAGECPCKQYNCQALCGLKFNNIRLRVKCTC